jgi:RNA polymerase sigma-70 factor (ECF subfamily)
MDHQNASSVVDNLILIREAQAGSHSAFSELISRYDQGALRLALRLSGSESDAQDICQEAFLRAYRNLRSFRIESSFYTWLYRIVANLCMDYLRKKRARNEQKLVSYDSSGRKCDLTDRVPDCRCVANPEQELLRHGLGERIQRSLNRLSHRERVVFELRHFHGLSLHCIGAILETRESVVKTSLFRATQKLRKALSSERPHAFLSRNDGRKNVACSQELETCPN